MIRRGETWANKHVGWVTDPPDPSNKRWVDDPPYTFVTPERGQTSLPMAPATLLETVYHAAAAIRHHMIDRLLDNLHQPNQIRRRDRQRWEDDDNP